MQGVLECDREQSLRVSIRLGVCKSKSLNPGGNVVLKIFQQQLFLILLSYTVKVP
jgi:hypothetical protein